MNPPSPPSPRHREALEVSLLAVPRAVPELRHRIRDHLGEPSVEVQLCVSELVTNVIDHLGHGTPVTVRVTSTDRSRTRVEVTDPDPRVLPVLLRAAPADESGRGLALLDALSLRWGVRQGTDSKTVWCELELSAGFDAAHRPPPNVAEASATGASATTSKCHSHTKG